MAIDEQDRAESALGAHHDLPQGAVIGLVEPFDAAHGLGHRELARIDLLPVADDPGNGAEPAGDA